MSQQTLANMLLIVINAFGWLSYVFMKLGLGTLQAFNIVEIAPQYCPLNKKRDLLIEESRQIVE